MNDEELGDAFVEEATKLLPAWFIPRMMEDVWSFGLLMTTGVTIAIQQIRSVHQAADGSIWIDVILSDGDDPFDASGKFVAPTSRLEASINTSHIVAAFELADT